MKEPWERTEVKYHEEDGSWWGEVVGWNGAFAAADTLDECRERMRELIPYGIDERLAGMARSLLSSWTATRKRRSPSTRMPPRRTRSTPNAPSPGARVEPDEREDAMTPEQRIELLRVADDLDRLSLRRSAGRIRAALDRDAAEDERPCAVQDRATGVRTIPWGLAEMLYPAYGHDQTLERLHERGGFSRMELGALAVDGYGSLGGTERPGRLKRWPLLDLYEAARANTSPALPAKSKEME